MYSVIGYCIKGDDEYTNILKALDISQLQYGLLVGLASNLMNSVFTIIAVLLYNILEYTAIPCQC